MSKKTQQKNRIPAKEFARVTSEACRSGATGIEELRTLLGHRAEYLARGLATNVDRRKGANCMNLVSSRSVYVAAGARPPVYANA